ncbi:MAG: hypothetical protein GY953_31770 [bacterium]|nr:hypothetical protein [bacterium]
MLLAPSADAAIKNRQRHQRVRIKQGVKSGELTKREARGLGTASARLGREIRRDRVDGGGLTPRERVKIHHKQDRLSGQVFRQKHDGQERR